MDLINIIMNAGASLSVYRAQVATASHNIANANTPGYARQEAVPTETIPGEEVGVNGYLGRGVTLEAVVQKRDTFVENQINVALGNSANSSAQADALSTITALDPKGNGGITDALGTFYSALRDLNQNPGDLGLRQAVVDSAQIVSRAFNTTVNSISTNRSAIDQNVTTLVDKVNGILASVADLNLRINLAVNSGRTPNDLLDIRQNKIDELAEMIGARPVPDNHSGVNIVLPDGTCLVTGVVASKLSIQANNSNSNHYDIVFTPSDGTKASPLSNNEMGGQIGGLLTVRDDTLGKAEASLDSLAYDLSTAINTQHALGYALDGTNGHALFAVLTAPSAAAKNLAVDATVAANPRLIAAAASATSGPGDATNLQKLIETEKTKLGNGLNAQQGMAKLTSDFGIASSAINDSAEFDKSLLNDLKSARESASGVSVDDEMINLTAAQTAYSALTKVVTATNAMLETLMKII